MTNLGWKFSGEELAAALGTDRVLLINDYEAIAHVIPVLRANDLRDIGLQPTRNPQPGRETIAIVGPGTGLGVGGYVRSGKELLPLVTEGGHADFAPADDIEVEILNNLRARFGPRFQRADSVWPRSGKSSRRSLRNRETSPGESNSANHHGWCAGGPSSFCALVLSRFCAILGAVAGNIALTMGAKQGVFLAGGILPVVADFLAESEFRARFEAKGRFASYMKNIPTRLIVNDDAGLLGAAVVLRNMMDR